MLIFTKLFIQYFSILFQLAIDNTKVSYFFIQFVCRCIEVVSLLLEASFYFNQLVPKLKRIFLITLRMMFTIEKRPLFKTVASIPRGFRISSWRRSLSIFSRFVLSILSLIGLMFSPIKRIFMDRSAFFARGQNSFLRVAEVFWRGTMMF